MITPLIILILLFSPLAAAFIYSKLNDNTLNVTKYACWGLGIAFVFFSIGHVAKAEGMVAMLPPWIPFRLTLVYLTGLLELLVAVGLFLSKYQTYSAKIAIVIFVVFFPANIYAALNGIGVGGHQWGAVYLLIRGPLQIVLVTWAYFLCVKNQNNSMLLSVDSSVD